MRLVVVTALLALVLLAAGGWYFSERIRADVLEVTPYPAVKDLRLQPVPGERVAISTEAEEDLRMLDAPSTFGLDWDGGYGQVSGPVVASGAGEVVRRLEVLAGRPPRAGTPADLDLEAFPDDPRAALGPGVSTVPVESPLGAFPAWFVPAGGAEGADEAAGADGTTWAITVHGKGGSRMEMVRMTRATVAAGLPSLVVTYRNDEGLPRDPSGRYQYGRTEWRDLAAAVEYAGSRGAERVVLGADSMGGAVVASYLRNRPAADGAPEVVGLVLDAPMLDLRSTIGFGADQLGLPLPGVVVDALTWTALQLAEARFDLDLDEVDYLDGDRWLRVPTLLFHGSADTTVPIATSRELAQQHPRLVQLVELPGVEHVRSWNADPGAYERAVDGLVDRVAAD